ncbi:MAG TPA: hypothetical protein EYG83_04905 [Sulfurospirillum arcachonense]|nr:hypothetical protein [Sulfurospirillum arcachonense]
MKKLLLWVLLSVNMIAEDITTELNDMYEEKSFLIAKSTTSYEEAKKFSKEISKALGIHIDYRGLSFHKSEFLSFSKKECEESWGDNAYPCYVPRGRYDDGEYISIEHTNSYDEFTNGYYIVIVASGDSTSKTLKKVKKKYNDAYMKKAKVYMGCIH